VAKVAVLAPAQRAEPVELELALDAVALVSAECMGDHQPVDDMEVPVEDCMAV
jgi:hypothetical protein